MRRWLVVGAGALLLNACTLWRPVAPPAPLPVRPAPAQLRDADGAPIEVIAFQAGVSSATVEKLAALRGCGGGEGAGLITPPGPVEIYRMLCSDGRVFKARCELRQCKAL